MTGYEGSYDYFRVWRKGKTYGVSTRECTQNGRSHQQNTDAGKGSRFVRPATDAHYWGEPDCQVATVTTLLSSQGSGKTTVELSSMLSKRNDKVLRKKGPLPGVTLFIEGKFWFLNKGIFNVTANICAIAYKSSHQKKTCVSNFMPQKGELPCLWRALRHRTSHELLGIQNIMGQSAKEKAARGQLTNRFLAPA